jgi:single-stranded-DNA-specific exonuclease
VKYQLRTKNYNNETPELALNDLLYDRGIEDPVAWLYPKEEYEHSPFRLSDMKKAVDIMHDTIMDAENNILVVVDSDLDGYTSGAIILSLLNQIGKGQDIDYVLHPGKEHGIELRDIPEDVDLIIVPDAGSSQKQEHLKLLSKGTKVIVLDHHEVDNDFDYGEYIDDIAIVNSQLDYPNPALSGAGVALKFVQAYCQTYGIQIPKKVYALAACGIVADVMDISSLENKQIITEGIKYIEEHPFLMALISKAHFNQENPKPSIKDIGWVIGPNINSIIRLGTMPQKHAIFNALVTPMSLTFSSKRGSEDEEVPLFEEAVRLCDNAKKRQTTAINKSIKIIEGDMPRDMHNSIVYVDEDQDLSFELSGLIANKLLSQTNKPVILLREYTDNKGNCQYRGSVRGKPAEGLTNLKETIKGITGVEMAEGHAFAFGIGIDRDSLPSFKMHLDQTLDLIDFNVNLYMVDLVADCKNVNKEIAQIMAADDVWSHGVEKPLGIVNNIPLDKYEIMGAEGQHVKVDCGQYDIVIFNAPELTERLERGEKHNINVVGEFDIDKAYNIGRLQFMVKDYELTEYTAPTIWDYAF